MNRSYRELITLETFEDRFNYLALSGMIGESTFGFDRYLNQMLYRSRQWRQLRDQIILRDNGCDMALPAFEIGGLIIIHHINPLTVEDLENESALVFDSENLVCVSHATHNAIHFGIADVKLLLPIERFAHDTVPWKNR